MAWDKNLFGIAVIFGPSKEVNTFIEKEVINFDTGCVVTI